MKDVPLKPNPKRRPLNCGNCPKWVPPDMQNDRGECHHLPPTLVTVGAQKINTALGPKTVPIIQAFWAGSLVDDWCAQHPNWSLFAMQHRPQGETMPIPERVNGEAEEVEGEEIAEAMNAANDEAKH